LELDGEDANLGVGVKGVEDEDGEGLRIYGFTLI
jgi:hypothetical protein